MYRLVGFWSIFFFYGLISIVYSQKGDSPPVHKAPAAPLFRDPIYDGAARLLTITDRAGIIKDLRNSNLKKG